MLIIDGNNLLHRELSNDNKFTGEHSIRMLYNRMATEPDTVVWVWDGYNSRKKRQAIYPEYKNHRAEKSEDIYAMFKLFGELLDCTSVIQINVPEWEADDVIYTLAKYYNKEGVSATINTNDADYLQIPNVSLPCVTKPHFPYHYVIAYKALCGDRIDNIPGMPRFGDGTWSNMAAHWDTIDQCLKTGDWDTWQKIPWPNRNRACLERENFDNCVMYYSIIKMIDVPLSEIEANISVGVANPQAAESLMSVYML